MMDLKLFKKIVSGCLTDSGFSKKGSFFYLHRGEFTIVIGLQKSNYGNGYYINIGYVINILNPIIEWSKDVDGDIRARFSLILNEKRVDYFELEYITNDTLLHSIEDNIHLYVSGIHTAEDLRNLLVSNPVMLYQTALKAKKFLKIE